MAKRKAPAALTKKMETSQELYDLTGKDKLSRAEAVKAIWKYIKDNDLQDPDDGRYFDCDAELKAVIGKKRGFMTDVAKAVSQNLSDD